ncbi:MAG: hypothetical protein BWY31_04702 [Lentisphaerae bacterium ADurb.Bin242]|nr:MAG: hypothetical protein BWY31_04702 [Lentisphaerae bacterium ADurb.Bin242]
MILFHPEMEKTGIIPRIGPLKEMAKAIIDICAVLEGLEGLVFLDAAILTDAEEDDAVYGALDSEIQLTAREGGIAEGDITGQVQPPGLYFIKECGIHFRGSPFASRCCGITVERALEHGVFGEHRGDIFPYFRIAVERIKMNSGDIRFIGAGWLYPAIVDGEFLEIRENAQGELGGPCVPSKLVRRIGIALDIG